MSSGCSDCVGSVPAAVQGDGAVVDGAPVPAASSEVEAEKKADTPPSPDDT